MTWLACGEKFFPDDKRSPELVREVGHRPDPGLSRERAWGGV